MPTHDSSSFSNAPFAYAAKGQTVLVVDDEETVRFLVTNQLERFGFRVLLAEDGAVAMTVFKANQDQVKLVITDVLMPNLDGVEVVRALRKLDPDLPVVVMSGFHSDLRVRELAAEGVTQFLYKPFTVANLTAALRASLDPSAEGELQARA